MKKIKTALLSRPWRPILLTIALLMISAACQTVPSSPVAISTSSPVSATNIAPQATNVSATTTSVPIVASATSTALKVTPTPSAGTATVQVVFGSGSFNYPYPQAGLANLSGYKATLSMSFNGTRNGKAQKWFKTYTMQSAKKPATIVLTIKRTGDLPDLNPVFMAEADGVEYQQRGKKACTATAIEPENSLRDRLEPAGFLNFVIGAEKVGSETVNQVAATRYSFDARAFGQADLVSATGEMWVASEGGYLVKYLLTTKGDAGYFGQGIEGTLTLDYTLTDINQSFPFQLPDDCPAGMVQAPLLPDASEVLSLPGILTYDTASSLTDVVAFYQKQIPNLGWKMIGAPTISQTTALMEFTQGNQTLTILIASDTKARAVQIILEKNRK